MNNHPVLPFVGPYTFLKSPIVDLRQWTCDPAALIFIGMPFDTGGSNRPGARYGPQAIREASMLYTYGDTDKPFTGVYDVDLDEMFLSDLKIYDAGDVEVYPLNITRSLDNMAAKIEIIYSQHGFPVIVGGDHSVTFGAISSIKKPVTIIQFDSHCDFMDIDSIDYCAHGGVMRRVSDLPNVEQIIHVGIRGLLNSRTGVKESVQRGNVLLRADMVISSGHRILEQYLSPNKQYYITFDIDSLDPSIAPGTGTPEPGGFSYLQAREMLRLIANICDVIGIDFVEVNPLYDPSKTTGLYATRLLIDFLGAKYARR